MGESIGGDLGGLTGSMVGGGATAWASGGDFWQGAQGGAYNQAFNWGLHEGLSAVRGFVGLLATRDSRNYEPATEEAAVKAGFEKQPVEKSLLHKFPVPGNLDAYNNVKYTSRDGHYEAVYNNGKLVRGLNGGTYNFYPATHWKHVTHDMLPFFVGL